MDRLGLVAKRWLLHDPYNPTSFADVMSAGLTRLAALYIILGMLIVLAYLRPAGRRTLGVLLVASVFVLGFAVAWQGGDRERYLALFPMLFLTVALGLTTLRSRIRQAIGLTLVLAAAWLNVPPISRARLAQQCNATARRLSAVPGRSGRDIVVTPHLLDDVAAFSNRCPAAAVMGEHGSPVIYGLVMPHNDFSYAWPDSMRARAERAWANSGHVWIAHRSLAAAPSREWDWAEGDDTRLKWGDFPAFFSQLEFGAPVGGVDGFQELLPTPRNRATLARLADSLSSRTH
jgi:hypothetical protein